MDIQSLQKVLEFQFRLKNQYSIILIQKKKSAYTHPWHWSINSLSNVFKFYGFEVVLTNDYFNENDLIIILKNSKKYNQDFEFDDIKKVINFFKRWKKESLFYKNLK